MENKKIDIDQLINSYLDFAENHQSLDQMLTDEGYNPEQLEKEGLLKIKKNLFKATVEAKKKHQEILYSKAITIFQSARAESKSMILSLLMQRAPQLQFRSLEKLQESDLKQILNESDILDLMEKISNESDE